MQVGSVIKKCRKLRGLTQLEVSELASLSESYLSLIEKDKRQPSLANLESIAKALKVPVSILVFLASDNSEISELTEPQIEKLTSTIYSLVKS